MAAVSRCATASADPTAQVVTEAGLIGRSDEFEAAISSPEKGALADFCAAKSGAAKSEDEAEAWAFMRVLFQDDPRRCGGANRTCWHAQIQWLLMQLRQPTSMRGVRKLTVSRPRQFSWCCSQPVTCSILPHASMQKC